MGDIAENMYPVSEEHSTGDDASKAELFHQEVPLPSLIEYQARLHPSRTCLVSSSETYNFATLWNLVIVNSQHFSQNGVSQNSRVAVVSETSPAAIVALLAIMKLGAIGVPLGSSIPDYRLEAIGKVAGLTEVVDLRPLSQRTHINGVEMLSLCRQAGDAETLVQLDAGPDIKPQSPAIVVFTSGSTGKPKGVVHSHASLSTMAVAVSDALSLNPHERNFLFPSFGWAVNIIDSFSTLGSGACLCIPTEEEKSHGLEDAICRFDATRITVPPSVLQMIHPTAVQSLTSIVLAGEPVRADLIRAWSSRVAIYWNYGSSETLMVLAGVIIDHSADFLNAGFPISCCRCYIEDDSGGLAPDGVSGQLVIESHTNFIGYIEQGKVCMVGHDSNPSSVVRSGDAFERSGPHSTFVHRGRMDAQLKILGQRFDPLEVETELCRSVQNVKDLAVTVATLQGNSRGPAVVVLVVLDQASSIRNLKCDHSSLKQALLSYMVPIGALQVDELPRLSNGKLDRRGVASLAQKGAMSELFDLRPSHRDRPNNSDAELTKEMTRVWANVLELPVEEIRPSSSFFLLGGNSIDAMRACKELRQTGINASASDFFLNPTLGAMVSLIETRIKLRSTSLEQESPAQTSVPKVAASELHELAIEQCKVDASLVEDIYPCTPMQASLMTLSEVQEGAYIAEHSFQLPQSWSEEGFVDAWLRVLMATPMLRTRIIRHQNGRLYNVTIRFDEHEALPLKGLPGAYPPMRCGCRLFLHSLSKDKSNNCLQWSWRVHHAIYDRWSTNLILDLVKRQHDGLELTHLTPFSLFASNVSEQQESEEHARFWKSKLEPFTGSVFPQLPPSHFICRAGSSVEFQMAIQRPRSATTQATSIQAALALLISKMNGELDVVFGMTVHGRASSRFPEAGTVIGPTITTFPVRIQLDYSMPLHAFLETVQSQVALMSDHEQYSLQNIKSVGPGCTSAASFTTLLIVQPPIGTVVNGGHECIEEMHNGISDSYVDYPLVIECFPHSTGVNARMLYDPEVLSTWQVEMMAQQLSHLLVHIEESSDPSTTIMDLNAMSAEHATNVIRRSSCDQIVQHLECLHERIFAKAVEWAADDALHGWDARYTYAQLQENVQKLSLRLQPRLKGAAGRIIPICYEKSVHAIVAMLSTLSAGYGFLMLDPVLPVERIKSMLEAMQADRIICSSLTMPYVLDIGALPVNLDNVAHSTLDNQELDSNIECSPDTPAYCIFTSGSTGSPKGVVVLHKQATSGLEAQCRVGLYPQKARILQFSSYSFDTCIADIFATLLSGGCVCVPEDKEKLLRISEDINKFSVNTVDLTPSVARMLQPEEVPSLEVLRLGGEPMHQHHVETWARRCNLQNTYGPTECCVQCVFIDHVWDTMSPSTIGKGIGCHTWVVDPQNHNHLMPLGAIGELAIQGPCVASGYINNSAKTQASFLERAPWLDTYNIKCEYPTYLTGDLVRFNEQGDLLFVGRADNQIKIRGQRVEPEEIEHVLRQNTSTHQAIVCYPTKGLLAFQLVAILEPSRSESHLLPSLSSSSKKHLPEHTLCWMETSAECAAKVLPHYMVPEVYLSSDKVLLMSSGKLDRQKMRQWLEQLSVDHLDSLPAYYRVEGSDADSPSNHVTESVLLAITEQIRYLLSWRSGNQHTNFSTRRSFSSIGLDSITIVPLLKWINTTYNMQMDMQTLLQLETAHNLASYLQGTRLDDSSECQVNYQDIISRGVDQLCNNSTPSEPQWRILLTGGSSLTGLNILLGILCHLTSTSIVVLMRCSHQETGRQRLLQRLKLLSGWRDEFTHRIEVWPGDLSQDRLGLPLSCWQQLQGESLINNIDIIVHNAALVDWFRDFRALQRVNVDAALSLVECARDSLSIKRLVYISGGPQWDPHESEVSILQGHGVEASLERSNDYGKTKMVTSIIIQKAAARSPVLASKVTVIRPALIIGSSADGVPNIDDFIWRVVRGCVSIRAFPRESEHSWVYLCGADQFASMVVQSLLEPARPGETRVDNGLYIKRFWQVISDELGLKLEGLEYSTWLQNMKADIDARDPSAVISHPCQPILPMFESGPNILGAPPPLPDDAEWRQKIEEESACALARNICYMTHIGCFSEPSPIWSAKVFDRCWDRTVCK
ncbi:hypothetical protein IL306_013149 [Fusarium sp. DS 682]|nr:hypothetical protein IL306_013149 [Fusarium sp. DS 682]